MEPLCGGGGGTLSCLVARLNDPTGALTLELLLGKQGGSVGGRRGNFPPLTQPSFSQTDRDQPASLFAVAKTPDPTGPGSLLEMSLSDLDLPH